MNKSRLLLVFALLYNAMFAQEIISLYELSTFENHAISEFASSIKDIPLETTDDCLLSDELQVLATDAYLFVHDFKADEVYQFNKQSGKYIRKIGKKGQGPGEYQKLFSIYADDGQKECFLMDTYAQVIYVYGYDGVFKKKWNFDFMPERMLKQGDNYVVINALMTHNKKDLYLIDKSGKTVKRSTINGDKKYGLMMWPPFLFRMNNTIYYKNNLSDQIYSVDESLQKKPVYKIDSKGKDMDPTVDQYNLKQGDRSKGSVILGPAFGYGATLFLPFANEKGRSFAVYDTKTKKLFIPGKDGVVGFADDLMQGPPVEVQYSAYLQMSLIGNELLSIVQPSALEDASFSGKFKSLMATLAPDSNPIIRIITLK